MKRDHTYLLTWISTEVIVTLLFVFAGSGPLSVLTRLNGRNVVMENWIFYLVGTLLLCLVLGIVMYRTGIRMNGKSKIESMALPVLDQIIAAGIYLVISAVFRFSYLVNPFACYLAIVFWSGGQVDYSPRAENIFHLLSLAFLQAFILGAVSLGAYALAKYKQDHKNPVLKKIREENQKQQSAEEKDPLRITLNMNGGSRRK